MPTKWKWYTCSKLFPPTDIVKVKPRRKKFQSIKSGEAGRETILWAFYEKFSPTPNPHLSFAPPSCYEVKAVNHGVDGRCVSLGGVFPIGRWASEWGWLGLDEQVSERGNWRWLGSEILQLLRSSSFSLLSLCSSSSSSLYFQFRDEQVSGGETEDDLVGSELLQLLRGGRSGQSCC